MVELRSGEILALAESSATDERAAAELRARQEEVAPAVSEAIGVDLPLALQMVGTLPGFWQDTGRVDEGRALTERAIEAGQRVASSNRAVALAISRALLAASELAFRQGDRKRSAKRARDAIRAAMLIEDRPTAALAHVDLARVACGNGDAKDAEKHAEQGARSGR